MSPIDYFVYIYLNLYKYSFAVFFKFWIRLIKLWFISLSFFIINKTNSIKFRLKLKRWVILFFMQYLKYFCFHLWAFFSIDTCMTEIPLLNFYNILKYFSCISNIYITLLNFFKYFLEYQNIKLGKMPLMEKGPSCRDIV